MSLKNALYFPTNAVEFRLQRGGVDNTPHPHMFDLTNPAHLDNIHRMFKFVSKINPNVIFEHSTI